MGVHQRRTFWNRGERNASDVNIDLSGPLGSRDTVRRLTDTLVESETSCKPQHWS